MANRGWGQNQEIARRWKRKKKGVPKHDGSGRGVRANQGRGGCATTEPTGAGRQ